MTASVLFTVRDPAGDEGGASGPDCFPRPATATALALEILRAFDRMSAGVALFDPRAIRVYANRRFRALETSPDVVRVVERLRRRVLGLDAPVPDAQQSVTITIRHTGYRLGWRPFRAEPLLPRGALLVTVEPLQTARIAVL